MWFSSEVFLDGLLLFLSHVCLLWTGHMGVVLLSHVEGLDLKQEAYLNNVKTEMQHVLIRIEIL